jgi:hypothetical protein
MQLSQGFYQILVSMVRPWPVNPGNLAGKNPNDALIDVYYNKSN